MMAATSQRARPITGSDGSSGVLVVGLFVLSVPRSDEEAQRHRFGPSFRRQIVFLGVFPFDTII